MKKQILKLTVLCITLLLSNQNFSQSANWIWASKVQSNTQFMQDGKICTTTANQTIYSGNFSNSVTIGATTHTVPSNFKGALIVKYDASGMLVWSKSFGPFSQSGSIGYSVILDIESNSLGEIFALGSFSTSLAIQGNTLTGTGSRSMYLVKFDANGNYIWGQSFSSGQRIIPYDLRVNNNGIFITGAFTGSQMTLGSYTLANNMISNGTEYEDLFVTKLDLNGNPMWAKTNVSFQGGREIGKAITTNTLGEVYVTGDMQDGGTTTFGTYTLSSPSASAGSDNFILKYDANGNVLWAKKVGSNNIDKAFGIEVDNAGNPVVVGNFYGPIFASSTNTISNSGSSTTADVYAVSFTSTGNNNWIKKVTNSSGEDLASGTAIDANNNLSIIGKFSSGSIIAAGSTLTPVGGTDMFIIKLDGSGNAILAAQAGNTFIDDGTSVAVDNLGDVYLTGQYSLQITFGTLPTLPGSFNTSNYIAKLSGGSTTNLNNALFNTSQNLSLYPNPANHSIQIKGFDFNEGVHVKISSMDGKLLKEEISNQSLISISDLNTGMYFIELTDTKGRTGITKFIKE